MGDTLEDLSHAGEAEVNLVVSSVGIPAANVLREKFGTPFLVGTPVEGYEGEISDALEKAAESFYEAFEYKKENPAEKNGTQISGRQEELWKVTPDQVLYLQKKTASRQNLSVQETIWKRSTKRSTDRIRFSLFRTSPSSGNRLPWAPWQQP